MRIVAGAFRGRPLVAPKGHLTRPTADRTRQALFNVLAHAPWSKALGGRRALDLFAGSGALGLEALSRGAAFCLFVDKTPAALQAIDANLDALGARDRALVRRRDAGALGPRTKADGPPFDLVFLDPPYGQGLGEAALAQLVAGDWLAPGALVALERGAGDPRPPTPGFEMLDERVWGAAAVAFLRWP